MSTRAGIRVKKSGEDDLYFYQPYDGYPTYLLVKLIHMKNKDNYDKFVKDMMIQFEEVYNYPGDINYSYVIDFDKEKIFTYSNRESYLLRIDLLDVNEIEIE